MYVRDTDPLPPNSGAPSSQCYDWGVCFSKFMAQSVANAQAASAQIAGPNSFASFGPAVVIDIARSQNARATADAVIPSPSPASQSRELLAAPKVVPLNVTEQEFSGCGARSAVVLPTVIPNQTITFPERAPVPVSVPQTASAPKYKNLCWALRNGAVDQSQFDPAEFQALQYRCSQLGYAGACIPPANIALWLDQQRRAGTLPHISVPQSVLDSIEPAPVLTAVNCPTSYQMGGMAAYRRRKGMGAAWGDAGSVPTSAGWPGASSGMSSGWGALLFFGAIGVGLYLMGGQRGRG